MKKYSVILLFIFSSFVSLAQSQDTLKNNLFLQYEQISAYYDRINLKIIINSVPEKTKYTIELFDITGLGIIKNDIYSINKRLEIPINLKQGIYILIVSSQNYSVTRKFRVN